MEAEFIEVIAEVRYWEDSVVDGVEDESGTLIPFKDGKLWKPVICISEGRVMNWPDGMIASIHYKVCDQGEYWLLDESGYRVAKWKGYYVPDKFLCHGDEGFGDYIILNIGEAGFISNYRKPEIKDSEWK